ncbi:MAG: ABC transporter permease [Oscillospiraceae bacterium]
MIRAVRKILTLLFTMVIVSFLTFAAFSRIPADPTTNMLGTQATPERVAALQEELGLNDPFLVRYGNWLGDALTGELGLSYQYSLPVSQLVREKLPTTLGLAVLSFFLIVVVSVPLGISAARRHGGILDRVTTGVNQVVMAVPPFFTGILLTWVFGIVLHWFSPGAFVPFAESPSAFFGYLFFPALSLALPRIAMSVRLLRSTILAELHQDYVRTAISRGNSETAVLYRHVLKNALPPVVTFLAQTAAEIVAGGILIEQVFSLPGLGRLLLSSIGNRDYPVVQAIVVILALWVVLANTAADLINQRIDPRLRRRGNR